MTTLYEIINVKNADIQLAVDFLLPYESRSVSLMSRLLKQRQANFFTHNTQQSVFFLKIKNAPITQESIRGIFLLTSGNFLLHYILPCDMHVIDTVKTFLHKKNLYGIAGMHESSQIPEACLPKPPKIIYDYYLMIYENSRCFGKNAENHLPEGFFVRRCFESDVENILPLQKSYYIQEVLPKGEQFNLHNCRAVLKNILSEQIVYGIAKENTDFFVAKAGTNAQGLAWSQIGGVYTDDAYRNRGFAQYLVRHLSASIDKEIVLFVKKENVPAIAAYKKAGFFINGAYRICYM